MERNRLHYLCYALLQKDEGKELVDTFRKYFSDNPPLPQPPEILAQFGGADMLCAYRSGSLALLKAIEQNAAIYRQQELAINEKAQKEGKQ